MTTYSYTIEIDDSERIMLDLALATLKEKCDLQMAKKQRAPCDAHLRSLASVQKKLATSGRPTSVNTFALQVDPPAETERQPESEFFTSRLIDHGELPWFEIRALASIGAGLLMRHLGDSKAINKLARLRAAYIDVKAAALAHARST